MDGLQGKTLLELMIWGYPYFWKHPNVPLDSKYGEHIFWVHPNERNMEPENSAILEKGDSFWKLIHFQGRTVSFRGCVKVRLGLRNAKMPSWSR